MWVERCIGDQQRRRELEHALAARGPSGLFQGSEAKLRLEPETVFVHRAQIRLIGVTEDRGQFDDFV
jgi:hypothetical protein